MTQAEKEHIEFQKQMFEVLNEITLGQIWSDPSNPNKQNPIMRALFGRKNTERLMRKYQQGKYVNVGALLIEEGYVPLKSEKNK